MFDLNIDTREEAIQLTVEVDGKMQHQEFRKYIS